MNPADTATPSKTKLWLGAFSGFYRPSADQIRGLDAISKFLYAARSVILVISAQAAIIGGLLATADRLFDAKRFALVLIAFVAAHMISNLSNDYFGYKRGHDTPDSPRMRYTVHPFAGNTLDAHVLATGLALLAAIGLGIGAFFIIEHGWLAAAFLAAGVALLFAYDAAPVSLKTIGLGELAVFVVWGPLMIGGGYAVITGRVSANAFYASIPYGLGVMTILIAKHLDQRDFDGGKGIRTLPVLLGEHIARRANVVTVALMYGVIVVLVALGHLTPFAAIVAAASPRALRAMSVMNRARPKTPPQNYVGWPLWYHRVCLVHNRLFGWLYILGLAVGAVWPNVRL